MRWLCPTCQRAVPLGLDTCPFCAGRPAESARKNSDSTNFFPPWLRLAAGILVAAALLALAAWVLWLSLAAPPAG